MIKRAPESARPRGGSDSQAWFWKLHDPLAPASPARWETALATLRSRRSGGAALVSEAKLRDIAGRFGSHIVASAGTHGLSESLLLAVIAVESAGQSRAVSGKGAQGLMQLIPATARRFGVSDSFDASQNISGGAAYLDWLLKEFDDDVVLALAGYNAGEGAVAKYKGVPPYAETRDYVVRVLDALVAAETLCSNRPRSPRQRCTLVPGLSS
ncbi:MAG TPA: lytic transglycosylase domain-containing protein [Thermohalobaculum sp.]|nr:lytic transglycosylase domain-containing protein [Thermohalobaculum sp.]